MPPSCSLLGGFVIGARVRCYGNIARTRNVSECLYSLHAWMFVSSSSSETQDPRFFVFMSVVVNRVFGSQGNSAFVYCSRQSWHVGRNVASLLTGFFGYGMRYGKGKGFPYSIPSVGTGADPGVQTVSLQVTVSYPPGGRLPLLSARPAVTSPAAEHHRPLAGTKLYCLVTEAHGCKQLA